ncbi:phospholipase D-like domain-containing protein [Hymenobacter koreensis]|uniref:phospholipase D n=1 Tax=Hymenobacter koreensis TaxID=1084523 RepID=A0ABP8JPM3_9BACT
MSSIITTEAFFSEIKAKILAEINSAKHTIYAAVAWFTDRELLAALEAKQQEGVQVGLAVARDAINQRLDFGPLKACGGCFYWIEGNLMHNKFCVIDSRDVITGSYNWTYRAATDNYENIVVTAGDYDLAFRYLSEFKRITGSENQPSVALAFDLGKVVRRMQVIGNLVQLQEQEDALRQTLRLSAEWSDPLAEQLHRHLMANEFAAALTLVHEFIRVQSQVVRYEDPLIAALKLEIRDFEYRLVAVETEIADAEHRLRQYNHTFTIKLGSISEEILRLKQEYARRHRQESPFSEREYAESKRRYEDFKQERQAEAQRPFQELDALGLEQLKKLHRRCVLLCHPDKVPEAQQAEATLLFQRVQESYERQDLEQLAIYAAQLANGIFRPSTDSTDSLEYLRLRRDRLAEQLAAAVQHLESTVQSEVYQQVCSITNWEQHFQELAEQLAQELARWESYVN